MVDKETCLLLESPQFVRFRLINRNSSQAKLILEINENQQGDTLICGIHPNSIKVEPYKAFDFHLELFSKSQGINNISGLRVYDEIAKHSYDIPRTKVTVNYSDRSLK
jgi:hypothetical protein